jgi:hypothetical protein
LTKCHSWLTRLTLEKSFNNSSNLISNSNRKTCNRFWIPNSNSSSKIHFMGWTWAHTLHLTLAYNIVVHLNLHMAQTKYLWWYSKLGFLIRVTPHRNTFNLRNVNLVELMHIMVNLTMNALQCIWWHDKLLVTITLGVLHLLPPCIRRLKRCILPSSAMPIRGQDLEEKGRIDLVVGAGVCEGESKGTNGMALRMEASGRTGRWGQKPRWERLNEWTREIESLGFSFFNIPLLDSWIWRK